VQFDATPTREAREVRASSLQLDIYEAWCRMVKYAVRVDACFVLGDCVDGVDRKGEGFAAWTTDRHAQVETAADLLSMVKTRKYYGVDGSRYHVDSNTSGDLLVMDKLGGTFGTDLAVVVDGVRIHLAHAIGHTSSPVSKATAPAKEAAFAEINLPIYGKFDLLLRGHRHDVYEWSNGRTRVAGCPSWKSRDHFAASHGLGMPAEFIGGLLLHVDKGRHWIEPLLTPLTQDHQFQEVTL
jgi:hypothetical protein